MAMAACYANYDMSLSQGVPQHQQHHQVHHVPVSMHQQGRISGAVITAPNVTPQKDYTTPLHVDCSVEYELPNQPKPPAGQRVEPLLMIHPCYFRKMESQRRSPFVNNMPNSSRSNMNQLTASNSSSAGTTASTSSSTRRITRQSQVLAPPQQQVSQQHHRQQQTVQTQHQTQQTQHYHQQLTQQLQQQQMSQMSQQAHYPSVTSVQQHQPSSSSTAQQYIEQARRAVIHSHGQSRTHHQNQSQSQVQSSSSSWDQIAAAAAVATSMPAAASGIVGLPAGVSMTGQSMYSKSVGKRDAMLSGGCGVYGTTTLHNNHSHSTNGANTALSNNNNTHSCINNNLNNCAAEVALSTLRWDLPDRSPMATVPSNYQAGPDSTPTILRDDKHTLSEKYRRQYLRSHRLHPYMMTAGAVGSTFPQLTTTAFPQMQQVSCYNV